MSKYEDDTENSSKESVINVIANALSRISTKDDPKGALMLIAALGLLNLSKGSDVPMNVARKLANVRNRG